MKTRKTIIKPDRDLIEAVMESGDEQAFRELYRRHTPRLLGFVWRLLPGNSPDGEDIVQETWIRACQGFRKFQWRSGFSTWLLGIGLNIVRDNLRHNQKTKVSAENMPCNPSGPGENHELRIDLGRSIQRLPDEYRMVLVLHDIEEWTHEQIAEKLEIPVGTTKSQLFRARKLMREWLSDKNGVKI